MYLNTVFKYNVSKYCPALTNSNFDIKSTAPSKQKFASRIIIIKKGV